MTRRFSEALTIAGKLERIIRMTQSLAEPGFWKKCSSCKKPIPYRGVYWVCNVSTCNRKRTGLVFCEVSCWDAHVPMMNHRESWAEERRAPSREEWQKILSGEDKPERKRAEKPASVQAQAAPAPSAPKVILRRSRGEHS